jgi:hypothetical protein
MTQETTSFAAALEAWGTPEDFNRRASQRLAAAVLAHPEFVAHQRQRQRAALIEEAADTLRALRWIVCPPGHVPVPRSLAEAKAMHALAESYIKEAERHAR